MKFKLKRPIKSVDGKKEIQEITAKDENDLSADDLLEVIALPTGRNLKDAICNITALTEDQIGSLHPSDYNKLATYVGKFLIEE